MNQDNQNIIQSNAGLVADVRDMIKQMRSGVAHTVNAGMTFLYWRIGKRIQMEVLKYERAEYGRRIIATLSQEFRYLCRRIPDRAAVARTAATKTPRCHQDFASTTGSEEERNRMILHAYTGRAFAKSDSGDFIPHVGMDRFTKTLIGWKEKLSRIVDQVELKKDDYNISPCCYILTGVTETYRPLSEFVAELGVIEAAAKEVDKALREILGKIGV